MNDNKWCAMCGKWGDHSSGSCPELHPSAPAPTEQQAPAGALGLGTGSGLKKLTLQIEVETSDLTPFTGINLQLQRAGSPEWKTELTFILPRAQRVRHGKHLLITRTTGQVIEVGEEDAPNIASQTAAPNTPQPKS